MTRDELELLTIAEAAELWRVSKRTVERWIEAGYVPVVPVGGRRRIRAVDAARIARCGIRTHTEVTNLNERSSR